MLWAKLAADISERVAAAAMVSNFEVFMVIILSGLVIAAVCLRWNNNNSSYRLRINY
jgi:hypothetical protein